MKKFVKNSPVLVGYEKLNSRKSGVVSSRLLMLGSGFITAPTCGYWRHLRIQTANTPCTLTPKIYTICTGKVPIPSITTSTIIPGFTGRAPIDVPQAITSPGFNVMSRERQLIIFSGDKIMSLAG